MPNYAGHTIEILDGFLRTKLGGTKLIIESCNFVKTRGIFPNRIGKIDNSGYFRDISGNIIGQFDDDGILRESSLFSGKGNGKPIGELK